MSSLHCISPLCVSVCLTLFQLHIKKAICSKKGRPTHPALPISSTSFLCPASTHGTAHRLINFPLWFNHQVKLKWHYKVLFGAEHVFSVFISFVLWLNLFANQKRQFIIKNNKEKSVIKIKECGAKQIHKDLFYSLNNANCFQSHRALGFKVSMKHKPFKQIKFQIKQAM